MAEPREQEYAGEALEFMLRESDYIRFLYRARKQWKGIMQKAAEINVKD